MKRPVYASEGTSRADLLAIINPDVSTRDLCDVTLLNTLHPTILSDPPVFRNDGRR